MIPVPPRPLSPAEHALIVRLLERAGLARGAHRSLEGLLVTATCECGCGSIDVAPAGPAAALAEASRVLADAYGAVQGGHPVGLLLWGTQSRVTGLEIYALAFDPPFELPSPDTVVDVPADFDPAI